MREGTKCPLSTGGIGLIGWHPSTSMMGSEHGVAIVACGPDFNEGILRDVVSYRVVENGSQSE